MDFALYMISPCQTVLIRQCPDSSLELLIVQVPISLSKAITFQVPISVHVRLSPPSHSFRRLLLEHDARHVRDLLGVRLPLRRRRRRQLRQRLRSLLRRHALGLHAHRRRGQSRERSSAMDKLARLDKVVKNYYLIYNLLSTFFFFFHLE